MCSDLFLDNKSIFTLDFEVNESSIIDDLPAKDDDMFPDLEIRDRLIKMVNEELLTEVA